MSLFWDSCLALIEQELPPQQFNTWIMPLSLEGENNPEAGLKLIAPNGFILKWVKERYLERIQAHCQRHFGEHVSISLGTPAAGQAKKSPAVATQTSAVSSSQIPSAQKANGIPGRQQNLKRVEDSYDKTRLLPAFTFDNLVVGKANELARAAAQSIAGSPGGSYNPLFIYGGAGLGKTHLVHAIGNNILKHHPEKVVRYVHAEDYYTDVVRAYQQKSFDVLKRDYRSLDVLMVDDVQFFKGKNRTQEEFFFVFNALIEAKKQIVLSCDTYPKDINGLDDRLVTRFARDRRIRFRLRRYERRRRA